MKALVLLALTGCISAGVEPVAAGKAERFPASINPSLEPRLMTVLRGQYPFNDKEIRRVAVLEEWGAWYEDEGVEQQSLVAAVGVFDPANSKCWSWTWVTFFRQRDKRVFLGEVGGPSTVYLIECDRLGGARQGAVGRGASLRRLTP